MKPISFVINIVGICAMMTFAPAIAFAIANSMTIKGVPAWPLLILDY